MGGPVSGTEGYGTQADALAVQYENIAFADVHRETMHLFPATPSRVLDVGAGTGRDAAALAALGHVVLAVEPTREMRAHAMRLHGGSGVDWLDDGLPRLDRVLARGQRFDLILLTAAWMHLDEAERETGMAALARLLAPGGRIVMSLRHGPVPAGRRMFDVAAAETDGLARRHGLRTVFEGSREGMFGQPGVWWTFLALEAAI